MRALNKILLFIILFVVANATAQDYILMTDTTGSGVPGSPYLDFENQLLNDSLWAISFDVSDYAEEDTPGQFAGSGGRFNQYFAFSESGDLGGELANGVKVISGIAETVFQSSEWRTVRIWANGDTVWFDVDDGTWTGFALPSDGNTTFQLDYFISGSSGTPPTDAADGKFDDLRVWDLTGYGGPWDRASVFAQDTTHYYPLDEGTGNTVDDSQTSDTAALINPWANQWQIREMTTWEGDTMWIDGTHTDARPTQTFWYDHFSNVTYHVWMGTDGNKYIKGVYHSSNDSIGDVQLVQNVEAYDSHSYPTIVMTDSGYVLVIGTDYGGDKMQIARSENPRDISAWDTNEFTSTFGYYDSLMRFPEYPFPYKARNGDIYIFHKQRPGPSGDQVIRWWYYIKSTDEGRTWSRRHLLLQRSGDPDGLNEIYVGQVTAEPYSEGAEERVWFTWIAAGGPTHDDYHHDLYCAYFVPDSNKIFGPGGESLDTTVTLNEMDGDSANIRLIYNSRASLGVYTGYINNVYPNNSDSIIVNSNWSWTGSSWDSLGQSIDPGDYNATRWSDDYWYLYGASTVFSSSNGRDFSSIENFTNPGDHNRAMSYMQNVLGPPEHANSIAQFFESATDSTNNYGWTIKSQAELEAAALYADRSARLAEQSSTTTVRVYVTDNTYGARSLVDTATNSVTLSVVSGSATVASSPISAVSGIATFTINTPTSIDETLFKATSGSLDSAYVYVYTSGEGLEYCDTAPIIYFSAVDTTSDVNNTSVGAIDVTIANGVAPLTYLWSPGGATTQDLTDVFANTYTLTVTDDSTCTGDTTIVLSNNYTDTTYIRALRLATDGHDDDIRPMGTMAYDRDSNMTYLVYMNTTGNGDPFVYTCDHNNSDTWDSGNTIATNSDDDNHNYPQIILPDDNRPVVFFGAHNNPLEFAKMDVAGDPTSWTHDTLTQCPDASYPMLIKARNGDLYCFYRVTDANIIRPLYYTKSIDNGITWSNPLMAIQRSVDAEGFREIYLGMIFEEPYRNGVNQRFHFSWTLSGASVPPGNHDWAREGIYHAYYEPISETFYSADGTSLGDSIDYDDMDAYCEIVAPQRSPLREGHQWYAIMNSVSDEGEVVVWGADSTDDSIDRVHYFSGSSWEQQSATGLTVFPKGIDWFNGKHYMIGNSRANIFQGTTDNGDNYTNDYYFNMPNAQSGIPTTTIPCRDGHPAARFWAKETGGEPGNVWVGEVRGDLEDSALVVKVDKSISTITGGDTTTIRAILCDDVAGGFGRVTDATNSVTLSIVSGGGSIVSTNPTNATDGKAEFSYVGNPFSIEEAVLQASATGLSSGRAHIYVDSVGSSLDTIRALVDTTTGMWAAKTNDAIIEYNVRTSSSLDTLLTGDVEGFTEWYYKSNQLIKGFPAIQNDTSVYGTDKLGIFRINTNAAIYLEGTTD